RLFYPVNRQQSVSSVRAECLTLSCCHDRCLWRTSRLGASNWITLIGSTAERATDSERFGLIQVSATTGLRFGCCPAPRGSLRNALWIHTIRHSSSSTV